MTTTGNFFSITVEAVPRRIALSGEVDLSNAPRLVEVAELLIETGGPGPIEVDASRVTFIDSAGLNALVQICNRSGPDSADVRVVGAIERIRRTFEIAGLGFLLA